MIDPLPPDAPVSPSALLCAEAMALFAANRLPEAEFRLKRAVTLDPANVTAQAGLGAVLLRTGQLAAAVAAFDAVLRSDPAHRDALRQRAEALLYLARPDEAIAGFKAYLVEVPGDAAATNHLIQLLMNEDRAEDAVLWLYGALEKTPKPEHAPLMLANVLRVLGRIGEARAVLSEHARSGGEFYLLADVKSFTPGDPAVAVMEDLLGTEMTPEDDVALKFALAKAYGDIGREEDGFALLGEANKAMRRLVRYQEAEAMSGFRRVRAAFPAGLIAAKSKIGHNSEMPIFILGMPRSGTTLVEQILASHPLVAGAGENAVVPPIVARYLRGFPEAIVAAADLKGFAEHYLAGMGRLLPGKARVTDKTLDSVFFAGLLHLAFPKARFVWVRRDPVDTCLSCYSRRFINGLEYSYDLGELGRYFRAYEGLMTHWQSVLPKDVFLTVEYEDVVTDLEGQTHRLLDHCGLSFDPACLEFHKAKRNVFSASAAQVRKPLYSSSVGRWRPSDEALRPLLAGLGEA